MLLLCATCLTVIVAGALWLTAAKGIAGSHNTAVSTAPSHQIMDRLFDVDIIVNGRPLEEYFARGKSYVEAVAGAEYEIRLRNPLPYRVAVALSVDGLNSIDARRSSAWNASKWVLGPYQTIHIAGWQMSSARARHFYFTTERDSYAAKLGQSSNLGLISAVFFRESTPTPVQITPPPRPRPLDDDAVREDRRSQAPSANSAGRGTMKAERDSSVIGPDDESAATGIGRDVHNDVRWVNVNLEPHPAAEVTIRYEYYPALVRLGIFPRPYPRPSSLRRREQATGFEDRQFSPEP